LAFCRIVWSNLELAGVIANHERAVEWENRTRRQAIPKSRNPYPRKTSRKKSPDAKPA
jgi:hypothetical protein